MRFSGVVDVLNNVTHGKIERSIHAREEDLFRICVLKIPISLDNNASLNPNSNTEFKIDQE
ncbi:MAG: hypothetical protein IPG90_19085 [Bacteroidetes bacterium]|nr:hypothetical protein [Bacteroidota bacterium]MBK6840123.1 hypothetical protein [Bacteroidota bacterium]